MESKSWSGWLWIGLAFSLLFGVFVALLAATVPIGGFYGMMGGGAWGWGFLMMIPAVILFVILVALLAGSGRPTPAVFYPTYVSSGGSALEVLAGRYARGELSREDYLRIRGDLT